MENNPFAILHETEKYGQVLVTKEIDSAELSVRWFASDLGGTIEAKINLRTEIKRNACFEKYKAFEKAETFMEDVTQSWEA